MVFVADGSPLSWWLDREGERRSYWGGFLPGVQQCSCSLEENCLDLNYFCNCDADTDAWYVTNYFSVVSYWNLVLLAFAQNTESQSSSMKQTLCDRGRTFTISAGTKKLSCFSKLCSLKVQDFSAQAVIPAERRVKQNTKTDLFTIICCDVNKLMRLGVFRLNVNIYLWLTGERWNAHHPFRKIWTFLQNCNER